MDKFLTGLVKYLRRNSGNCVMDGNYAEKKKNSNHFWDAKIK
jgi:hypothetical protein